MRLPEAVTYREMIGGGILTDHLTGAVAAVQTNGTETVEEKAAALVYRRTQRLPYRLFEAALDADRVPETERETWRARFGESMLLECLQDLDWVGGTE